MNRIVEEYKREREGGGGIYDNVIDKYIIQISISNI